jgi:predicted negative regulator of RcsB-dependent stress response
VSYSEEEQIENLKRFWDDYGTFILVVAALVVAAFAGWRYWQTNKVNQATLATSVYQDVTGSIQKLQTNPADQKANTDLQKNAQKLMQDFAGTPYASSAALALAKHAVDSNDLKEAEKQLRWVLTQKPEEGTRIIATVRLARVLAGKGDTAAALALLANENDDAFVPLVQEARGDIFVAQGKTDEARKAYAAADAAAAKRAEQRPFLETKMADVGVAPAERADLDGAKAAAK